MNETADRRATFSGLAQRWDSFRPAGTQDAAVVRGLELVEPLAGRVVVDVGCGTGLLEGHLLPRIGAGRVVAIDFAAPMLELGRQRCPAPQVEWLCRDVLESGLGDASTDVVLCFNTLPHFDDPAAVLREWARWLRPGGLALVWHDVGREQLAAIHASAGGAVAHDHLPPVANLATLFAAAGFEALRAEEDEVSYTCLARRLGA